MYDYTVIGAGYGGLAASALLQKKGFKVLLLEAHTEIGGCASFYDRKNFRFDVGATTFSGIKPNQPIGKLFTELEIKPELIKIEPGICIIKDYKKIYRYSDLEKWINEIEKFFPNKKMRDFWERIHRIDENAWNLLHENKFLPPRKFIDLISLVKIQNIKKISLLLSSFESMSRFLTRLNLYSIEFKEFLDELLWITTQTTSDNAPTLTAAMGLAYPAETYYPIGGMISVAEKILEKFIDCGGVYLNKKEVTKILEEKNYYSIKTSSGDEFLSKGIVSNIPIWNMEEITEGKIQKYFGNFVKKYPSTWSAFTVYFAIESNFDLETCYYQIHTKTQIPNCEPKAFFVSFSHKQDTKKAPSGFKTVTISTHTNSKEWIGIPKEEYKAKKAKTIEFILTEFDRAFPELRESKKLFVLGGTAKSFEDYTFRKNGFVGGIPHTVIPHLLQMPPNETAFPNLYMVGDTVFPGQGTPAVVQSAWNVVNRILRN
ncbi:MAG: NAD(P)/FAD-dependent oxidoreductase [Leptospiraceae bacterium]|nr:NAD(P)/FAD-dependent oxidoreductase [Leptospiraceae bacterium]